MKTVRAFRVIAALNIVLATAALSACGATDDSTGVSQSLAISGTPTSQIQATQTYAFRPTVANASTTSTNFSISNTPSWASFDSKTGELSGTPSTSNVGTYSDIVISASDGATTAVLPSFKIAVTAAEAAASAASPTVTLSASPTTVTTGAASALTWSTTGVSACHGEDGWTGSKSPSGTASTGALKATTTFTLICVSATNVWASNSVTITTKAASTSTSTSTSTTSTGTASTGTKSSGTTTTSSSGSSTSTTTTTTSTSSTGTAEPTGPGATAVFSYPSGFASATGAIQFAADTQLSGSAIELTRLVSGVHEAGAAWYKVQQNITSFTTDFTFQVDPAGFGFTFCIQNTNSAIDPLAYGSAASADANMLGYSAGSNPGQYPIYKSIAVKFDLEGGNQYGGVAQPEALNSTGLYINGGPGVPNNQFIMIPEQDLNPSGINLHADHVMAAHLVYDGSVLTMTLRDTTTNAQYRTSWPVNIPAITGSDTAWVGFTAGTVPAANQNILTWSFSDGYEQRLPAPTMSTAAGTYTSAQTVSMSAYSGATIYYTTNGQQPTTSSAKYTAPISVSSSEVVQAIAVESGYTDSTVAVTNYQIAPASTPLIDFASGFASASNLVTVNGAAKFSGSAVQLTNTTNYLEAGSAWYVAPVNVQSFTTHFTMQLLSPSANGLTFTIQNQLPAASDSNTSNLSVSGGPNTLGSNQSGLGYAGILSSVAVKFDLYTGTGNTTGLYTDGVAPTASGIDMTSSGLSLHSGDPLAVTMTYNGTTLQMTITDTKTNATFTHSWTVNIPSIVGGDTAYVGFTAGTGGGTAIQDITAWTYAH